MGTSIDVDVYVGRPSDGEGVDRDLGSRVVMGLTKPFHNKHYHVYCDNFFTSPALFNELLQCGLYACGTVRMDRRGFPG